MQVTSWEQNLGQVLPGPHTPVKSSERSIGVWYRHTEPETIFSWLAWTLGLLLSRITFKPHMAAQIPFLYSRETARLLYSSSRVAKAVGSELLRSSGYTSLQKVTLIPEQKWVDGRKCRLAGSAPPQGTQRTSILLGMFLDFTFRKGESGNNQDRMPVIVLAWWQHTAVLALFLYSSEREDSGALWAACWQSAECPPL